MSLTPNDLQKILEPVSELFSRPMTPEILNLWFGLLGQYSPEEIRSAFSRFIQTESRMPLPADILKIIRGSEEDRALEALMKVEKAMDEHGAYATVVFDDPAIHVTIQSLGGWVKACRQTEYEFTWWKKDFRERYQMIEQRGLPPDVPLKLFGIFDQTNLPMGRPPQTPQMIGDPGKIREWIARVEEPRSLEERAALLSMVRTVLKPIPSDAILF